MTSKPEDICSKLSFKKITKCEGVVDYKIQSELVRGQHDLIWCQCNQPHTKP